MKAIRYPLDKKVGERPSLSFVKLIGILSQFKEDNLTTMFGSIPLQTYFPHDYLSLR